MSNDNSQLADRFAIRELIDRYCYAINERDWAVLESCYTEDAVWDVGTPLNYYFEGRQAILAFCRANLPLGDFVWLTPHATVIWLDGDNKARAHSTMMELTRSKGGTAGTQKLATYADNLVKIDGEWRFKVHTFRVTNIEFTAPAGDCYKEWNAG